MKQNSNLLKQSQRVLNMISNSVLFEGFRLAGRVGVILLFAGIVGRANGQGELIWEEDRLGISVFEQNGHEYLVHPTDGDFAIFARTPIFEGEEFQDDGVAVQETADSPSGGLLFIYPWGELDTVLQAVDKGFDLKVVVKNTSAKTIDRLNIQFLRLTFSQPALISVNGEAPQVFDGGIWPVFSMEDSNNSVVASCPMGTISVRVTAEPNMEGVAGFFFAELEGLTSRIAVSLVYIPPGESRSFTLHIRPD